MTSSESALAIETENAIQASKFCLQESNPEEFAQLFFYSDIVREVLFLLRRDRLTPSDNTLHDLVIDCIKKRRDRGLDNTLHSPPIDQPVRHL